MTEQDTFETRLATALRALADEVPVDVDPVMLTHTVSSARAGRGGMWFVSRPVWFAGAAAVVVLAVIGLALPLGQPGPDGASMASPTPSTAAPSTTRSPSGPPSQTPSPTPPSASPSPTMGEQLRDGHRLITGGSRVFFSIQVPAHWTVKPVPAGS